MKDWIKPIARCGACKEALDWAEVYDSPEDAWTACERGDWMLWCIGLLDKSAPFSNERKPLVRAAVECSRLAWKWMPDEGRACLELHERWANGEDIPRGDLKAARKRAYNAAYAAAGAAASAAAYAAGAAASAAVYSAAGAAAYAAYAAAGAANAAYDAAWESTMRDCADIVRRHFPQPPEVK